MEMNHLERWKAISNRIKGLMQAAELDARYLSVKSSDQYGRWRRLHLHTGDVFSALKEFQEGYDEALSLHAQHIIKEFIDDTKRLIEAKAPSQDKAHASLVMLAAFETEMSFELTDTQEAIRVRSERAFGHLRRSIVADKDFGNKWIEAFETGEVSCERLGSIHLLLHGIWAFKAHAEKGRTDLVFQEFSGDNREEQGYADGLVLTEWKVARDGDDTAAKFKEARDQATDYAQGVLGGSELTGYRYAVVVSRKQVDVPSDLSVDNVIWRHINISVEPDLPSVASRKPR